MSMLAAVLVIAAVVCCGLCVYGIGTAIRRRRHGLTAR